MKRKKKLELDITELADEYGLFAIIGHDNKNTGCRIVRRIEDKYYAEDWSDMTWDEQVAFLTDLQGMYSLFSHFLKQKEKEE